VLQNNEQAKELNRRVYYTPYAREELRLAIETMNDPDPVTRAWSFLVRTNFTIGGNEKCLISQFDMRFRGTGTVKPKSWGGYGRNLVKIINRFKNVYLTEEDALELIEGRVDWDENTLIYCDPPYVPGTRKSTHKYRLEMDEGKHERLCQILLNVPTLVVLSGYDNDIYNDILRGWGKRTAVSLTQSHNEATECVWLSPRVKEYVEKDLKLF
jgi:DNA adenine methylase